MSKLYASAQRNLVWLGEDEDGSGARAFGSIRTFLKMWAEIQSTARPPSCPQKGVMGLGLVRELGALLDIPALMSVYGRTLFNRLWIVQEVVLAKSNLCLCGHAQIDLLDLLSGNSWVLSYMEHLELVQEGLIDKDVAFMDSVWARPLPLEKMVNEQSAFREKSTLSLSGLLMYTEPFAATDPRDALFGMLGIYQHFKQEDLPNLLAPDYTKSLVDVPIDATRFAVQETLSLQHLSDVRNAIGRHRSDWNEPSWVPMLGRARSDRRQPGWDFRAHDNEDVESTDRSTDERRVLLLRGFAVDQVASVSTPYDEICDADGFISHILQTLPKSSEDLVATGFVLCAGEWPEQSVDAHHSAIPTDEDADAIKTMVATLTDVASRKPPGEKHTAEQGARLSDDAETYLIQINMVCNTRRIFTTQQGYMGIAADDVDIGDFVTVARGCELPLIIRPLANSSSDFELVDVSYVHGIMQGEAMREHMEAGHELQTFRIL